MGQFSRLHPCYSEENFSVTSTSKDSTIVRAFWGNLPIITHYQFHPSRAIIQVQTVPFCFSAAGESYNPSQKDGTTQNIDALDNLQNTYMMQSVLGQVSVIFRALETSLGVHYGT